jgi:hypothetical protein
LSLGKEIQGLIAARIHDWGGDVLALLASELDALNPYLRDPINSALGKSTRIQPHVVTAVATTSIPNEKVGQTDQTADSSASLEPVTNRDNEHKYDALYELGRLTNYINQMNMLLNRGMEDAARLERDLSQAKIKLGAARREKEDAKMRCTIVEGDLAESLARSKRLEESVESYQNQIERLKSRLADAENLHRSTMESHNTHADELSARIAKEGDHRLTTFCNKLAGMLRPIATDLKEAQNMEMTPELGIAMRTQLRQILNMMKSQGIAIDGDEA